MSCRICEGPVEVFLDLGDQPISDSFLPAPPAGSGPAPTVYPLQVGRCETCRMVQQTHEVPRDQMFGQDYPYRTDGSALMREHFTGTADSILSRLTDRGDPFVVEVGANDGTMLQVLARNGVRHLGVDPSGGVLAAAREKGVSTLEAYFESSTAHSILAEHGPADVIYSANTMCHIPYLADVLTAAAGLLRDDGVLIFEDPYLGDVLAKTSFDQIYDEHFYLFSAQSIQEAARRCGLELVDVERLPVHGGEVRYTLAKPGQHQVTSAVTAILQQEAADGMSEMPVLREFAERVRQNADKLRDLLQDLASQGHTIAAYGATAKSATVTNYCRIGPDLVRYVVDSTPEKQGRLTPGMGIPVVPPDTFSQDTPDYALLFAWNHAPEIMAKELDFRAGGGRWIRYVPDVQVIDG